jgi:hypothetical protein
MAMITLIASYSLFNECAQHCLHADAGRASPRPQGFNPEIGFYAVGFSRQIRPAPVKPAVGSIMNKIPIVFTWVGKAPS